MKRSVLLFLLLSSCAPKTVPHAPPALKALADDFWAEELRHSPMWATQLGDHSHDDVLDDDSEAERTRHHEALSGFLARLKSIDRAQLTRGENITADVLEQQISTHLDDEVCKKWLWTIDFLEGQQIRFADIPVFQKVTDDASLHALSARYRKIQPWFETEVRNLRGGLGQ